MIGVVSHKMSKSYQLEFLFINKIITFCFVSIIIKQKQDSNKYYYLLIFPIILQTPSMLAVLFSTHGAGSEKSNILHF